MDRILTGLMNGIQFCGKVQPDMETLLTKYNLPDTIAHCNRVAAFARSMAARFQVDQQAAETAGLLHDISGVFPVEERVQIARDLGVDVLPEEEAVPMILHQKLSAVVAGELFQIKNAAILSAIGCHTTLKAHASRLDQIVFVADKIEWDQSGKPPYYEGILSALEYSLEQAVFCYLDFMWRQRETLRVIHPWLAEAYHEFSNQS